VNWLVLVELVKSSNKHQNNNNGGEELTLFPSSFYIEDGKYVFTKEFHLSRGHCCGNFCRHCAYEPKHVKNNKNIKKDIDD
jgi:hypothetical protein